MYKVYGKDWCAYCDRAKKLLEEKKLNYEYYNIEQDPESYKYAMENSNGQRTVPIIFEGNELIGGFDQLRTRLR